MFCWLGPFSINLPIKLIFGIKFIRAHCFSDDHWWASPYIFKRMAKNDARWSSLEAPWRRKPTNLWKCFEKSENVLISIIPLDAKCSWEYAWRGSDCMKIKIFRMRWCASHNLQNIPLYNLNDLMIFKWIRN